MNECENNSQSFAFEFVCPCFVLFCFTEQGTSLLRADGKQAGDAPHLKCMEDNVCKPVLLLKCLHSQKQ